MAVLALLLIAVGCSRVDTEGALENDPDLELPKPPGAADPNSNDARTEAAENAPEAATPPATAEVAAASDEPIEAQDSLHRQRALCPDDSGSGYGLTATGQEMFADRLARDPAVPEYRLAADIDPASGEVVGSVWMRLPAAAGEDLAFRVFPAMTAFESGFAVDNVKVNGQPSTARGAVALLTITDTDQSSADTDGWQVVEMDFTYRLQESAANDSDIFGALSGETLQPDQVGLLGRTETGAQLGHWFPVWLPPEARADADPRGFGDIGAFPAATICAAVSVPEEYELLTGGSHLADGTIDGRQVHVEGAVGLRDMALLISNTLTSAEAEVDGVMVRAWGPKSDPAATQTVLDYSVTSQQALVDAFGPYPWTEVEVVAAPLGSGVGGMEWPGMVWIESNAYVGGLPGLGDLGSLFESEMFAGVLETMPGGAAIETTLEWTIAHELGHEWWHALVGNDSIASPAVDEPLAQFSACIAMVEIHPENWQEICNAQTIDQYAQARGLMGMNDAPAEQASDAFESSIQYGAIVYGKAPGFYFEAAEVMGWDALIDSLESFVAEHAFELVGTDVLRSHLVDSAGSDGEAIGALWDRWFRGVHGDEDIGVQDVSELGLPGGIDLDALEGMPLDGLNLENLDLENLDLENLDLENLDLEELLGGEGAAGIASLLEELLGG